MRLARLALIPLLTAVCVLPFSLCDDDLEQQLAVAADKSSFTVQLASCISTDDLPAGEAQQIAYVSTRLCGKGFLNITEQVNRGLLQDVTELTNFNSTSYYLFDVTKATAAVLAPVTYTRGTGMTCLHQCTDIEQRWHRHALPL